MAQQIPVLILKEGTQRTRGKDAQRNNIAAAILVGDVIKTALGPRGMDKMLVDSFGDITVSNDGATILKEMDIAHPAAKMVVEVAKTVDQEVGDGTTTSAVLTGELLKEAEKLLDEKIHPTVIVEGYRAAARKASEILEEIAEPVDLENTKTLKKILKDAAMTSMSSKFVSTNKEMLADLVVNAVLEIAKKNEDGTYKVKKDNVRLVKKEGASVDKTELVHGLVLDKEVVHAGMPKKVENAKIALLEAPLEITKTEFDAKINISDPDQMQLFMQEEENMLREMVDAIVKTGANVVFCQKGIDDLAQHFLAKSGVLAVRRVKRSDIEAIHKATGATIVTNITQMTEKDLGKAKIVEERKVQEDNMVFIEGVPNKDVITIMIRGGTEHVVDEVKRALDDAVSVVRNILQNPKIVYGGGATEIELALRLYKYANSLEGRSQLAAESFARALESIPAILASNAGLEPIDIIAELKKAHSAENAKSYGIDLFKGKVVDMSKGRVIEPMIVKQQAILSASEASEMILRIDDVITAKAGGGPKPPNPENRPPDED